MKKHFGIFFLLLPGVFFSVLPPLRASDLFSFVPRNSACALFLDLSEQNLRMPVLQERLEDFLDTYDKGLLRKNNLKIKDVCSSLVISMPSLTKSDGYVLLKTVLPEQRFRELLTKNPVPGVECSVGKFQGRNVYEISFRTDRVSGGKTKVKIHTFALMYLAPDILMVTKDSIAPYFQEPRGLPANNLSMIKVPHAFLSGFAVTDDSFLSENPFLPPSKRNSFSAVFGNRENIVLKSEFQTVCPEDAGQTQLLLQQYLLLAGLFLNNENPALMQELTSAFQVRRNGLNVTMNATLSKEFFQLLGDAASNLQSRFGQMEQFRDQTGTQPRIQK